MTADRRGGRASWHARTNMIALAYVAAAVLAVPVHAWGAAPRWLVIHLFLLGAVTNAIVAWTAHFTTALLRARGPSPRAAAARLVLLNFALVAVLGGVTADVPAIAISGAAVLAAVIAVHLATLVLGGRRALNGRFADVTRFYWVAAAALLAGIGFGTALLIGLPPGWHERIYLAHVHANLFGWIALSVLGTEVTLWPTVLRTRIVAGAEVAARQALVVTAAGLILTLAGVLAGSRTVTGAGLGVYIFGVVVALDPFLRTMRARRPHTPASWMLAAGTAWLLIALAVDLGLVLAAPDSATLAGWIGALVPVVLTGFVAQVLLGALTYLLPVLLGRGPSGGRAAAARLDRWGATRVLSLNAGVALLTVPSPEPIAVAGWVLVGAALLGFLVLAALTVRDTKRTPAGTPGPESAGPSPQASRRPLLGGFALGGALLLVAVTIAGVRDGGSRETGSVALAAAGDTRGVQVRLADMDITPAEITVVPGTRVVLEVTNVDATRHDLAFPGGPKTPLLAPGESQELDLGAITQDHRGWCTVPGHEAAGMTLTVTTSAAGTPGAAADPGPAVIAPGEQPGAGFRPYDATLPPAGDIQTHKVTLRVSDETLEVAPGVRQRMWTFGGSVPGPVLRGRIGDVFEVTLINDATIGHSIDFHAGALAPDRAMRTIEPGERLTYRFTATHAGAWLYHCSTMPMAQHVGNGMYGAVIIDPPALPPVDREYVLVQSELYLGPPGELGDVAKMRHGDPDAVVFNGYYDHAPWRAAVEERVRVWAVNAGLTRPSAFHVVGAQFDTVFAEGAYLLQPGSAERGAAQALALQPGQGGFVELAFPAPGHYPFLSHLMVDAERGAHGMVTVGR